MSTGEPGFPLVASDEQIRRREFATVRRGYDPNQVRVYLASLADHVEELERALADARARAAQRETAPPPPAVDPYEQLSKRFAGVLATADSEAEQIVEEARGEADRIKAEAQARAEEARVRSSQSLIAAQQESDRMLSNLTERREAMLRQLHDMQARLLAVADDLEGAIQPSAVPPATAATSFAAAPPVAVPDGEPLPAASDAAGPAAVPTAEPERPERRPDEPAPQAQEPVPLEDLWVARTPAPPPAEAGLAGLFDESPDDVDLPDLSGIDLELDDETDAER